MECLALPEIKEMSSMGRRFQCPDCNTVSSASKWDGRTKVEYDEGVTLTSIENDYERKMCSFFCPGCGCDIPGNEIVERGGKFPLWTVAFINKDGIHTFIECENLDEVWQELTDLKAIGQDMDDVNIFPPKSNVTYDELRQM